MALQPHILCKAKNDCHRAKTIVTEQKRLSPNGYFKNSRSLSNFQVDCSQATKNYISKHGLSGACSLSKLFMCSGITRQESSSQDRLHFPSHEEDSALLVVWRYIVSCPQDGSRSQWDHVFQFLHWQCTGKRVEVGILAHFCRHWAITNLEPILAQQEG